MSAASSYLMYARMVISAGITDIDCKQHQSRKTSSKGADGIAVVVTAGSKAGDCTKLLS
jgi:hypothetical protein